MVRFDFVQRSLFAKINRALEAKENVMALHVLNRLYQVDWDCSILTDGDVTTYGEIALLDVEIWIA